MAKYATQGDQALAATKISSLTIASNATTVQRNKVAEFNIADQGTPADNVVIHTVQRCTALGTNTAVTPTKLDNADRAAQALIGSNHTAEPTYTAGELLWRMGLNTRASYRWVAVPGYEWITPATAASGIGWAALHASATTVWEVSITFEE